MTVEEWIPSVDVFQKSGDIVRKIVVFQSSLFNMFK